MNVGRAWPPRALRKTLERNIPRFAALSNPPLDAAQFSVENFSVGVPNHEEDVKRLEQDHSDAEKKSQAQMFGRRPPHPARSKQNSRVHRKWDRKRFMSDAKKWLRFVRLQWSSTALVPYADLINDFCVHLVVRGVCCVNRRAKRTPISG